MANFVLGFSKWKKEWFHEYVDNPIYLDTFFSKALFFIHSRLPFRKTNLYVWSYSDGRKLKTNNMYRVVRVEDGFLRSKGLGSNKVPPESLFFDTSGYLYFDGTRKSDIDDVIFNRELTEDEKCQSLILAEIVKNKNVTKYNLSYDVLDFPIDSILVIGQVEDDLAIKYGGGFKTNLELVQLAIKENPGKDIFFKRHPDVVSGNRVEESGFEVIKEISTVLEVGLKAQDITRQFSRVYVNTSLMGFELIIHGCDVRVVGRPFYSGLGFTDDYQVVRKNPPEITLEELIYKIYELCPQYRQGGVSQLLSGSVI